MLQEWKKDFWLNTGACLSFSGLLGSLFYCSTMWAIGGDEVSPLQFFCSVMPLMLLMAFVMFMATFIALSMEGVKAAAAAIFFLLIVAMIICGTMPLLHSGVVDVTSFNGDNYRLIDNSLPDDRLYTLYRCDWWRFSCDKIWESEVNFGLLPYYSDSGSAYLVVDEEANTISVEFTEALPWGHTLFVYEVESE